MNTPQVRFGDWIKTDEGWVQYRYIIEIDIIPQGDSNHPATKDQDAFYVELTIDMVDKWVLDRDAWERGATHSDVLQLNDYHKREVFRGNKVECEAIVKEIIGQPDADFGNVDY